MRNRPSPVQVYRAVIKSIEANNTCTVELLNSDLIVDQVSLVAEEDAGEWIKIKPRVGSIVLVGCVENEIGDLYLVQPGEIDGGEILIGDTLINFDKDSINLVNDQSTVAISQGSVSITQERAEINLQEGKVSIKNDAVSLADLFEDLGALLTSFKVVTAQGPSTALFPDTLASVEAFKLKYPQLLS